MAQDAGVGIGSALFPVRHIDDLGPQGARWDASRLLLFPKDRRIRFFHLPIEQIIRARPRMDLASANLTVEAAGMLVRMLLSCRSVFHPAIGTGKKFGAP